MLSIFIAATAATGYITYPEFIDSTANVEAVTDLGPVLEVVVKCKSGSAIMSYSKIERTFCTPKWTCYKDLDKAIARSCR